MKVSAAIIALIGTNAVKVQNDKWIQWPDTYEVQGRLVQMGVPDAPAEEEEKCFTYEKTEGCTNGHNI